MSLADEEQEKDDPILHPEDIAPYFRVKPKTVSRWIERGLIIGFQTPGGRYVARESEVHKARKEFEFRDRGPFRERQSRDSGTNA
jgi:hypothetical protein